jgi:prephenate dehydrogenase
VEFKKITIVGVGLIGGSLARALKASGKVDTVAGVDADEATLRFAMENGFIDRGSTLVEEEAPHADVVVVATHVSLIPRLALRAASVLGSGEVLTDTGSVKGWIVEAIENALPPGVEFVGGHPIAGREKEGVWHSDPLLFSGRLAIITKTPHTSGHAMEKVARMWEAVGARVSFLSPGEHDRIFAFVSHLPHAVAYALINAVTSENNPPDMMTYAGGGLNDFTRIAESPPEMWRDIMLVNRNEVLYAVDRFKHSLERIEKAIARGDGDALLDELKAAATAKRGNPRRSK